MHESVPSQRSIAARGILLAALLVLPGQVTGEWYEAEAAKKANERLLARAAGAPVEGDSGALLGWAAGNPDESYALGGSFLVALLGAVMTPRIRLPEPFCAPYAAQGLRLVEHCHLDVRAIEVGLALVLEANVEACLLVPPDRARRVLQVLGSWGSWRVRRGAMTEVQEQRVARLVDGGPWLATDPDVVPHGVEFVIVAEAHRQRAPAIPSSGLIIGAICPEGHWWRRLCKAPPDGASLYQVKAPEAVEAFPGLARSVDTTAPGYGRLMLLRDEPPLLTPFGTFAVHRLKIRTLKGPEFLSPRQQEEAREQLGEGWKRGRGTPSVSFEPSRLQRRYLAHRRLGQMQGFRKFLLLKFRRGGFTTVRQGQQYQACRELPNVYVATIADTVDRTRRIFALANHFREKDPHPPRLVSDSKSELEFENGSKMFIGTAGGNAAFRSDGLRMVHGSETAYWCPGPRQVSDVEELMAGVTGAAEGGEIDLETTPNRREWFFHTWQDAKAKRNDWWPIFVRWFDDPGNVAREGSYDPAEILETLREDEKDLIARHGLSMGQIAFRRARQIEYGRLFPQEMPEDDETCFLTSGQRFFDVEAVVAMLRILPTYPKRHLPGGYEVRVEEPREGVEYVGGCDTSEGLPGCDPNGVGILRRDTGQQVAWIHGLFKPPELATHAVRICREYNDALLGVERENHGHAVLLRIRDLGYSEPHFRGGSLYYFAGKPAHRGTWREGWTTNAITRPRMLDNLAEVIDGCHEGIRDRDFLSECLSFGQQTNGRYEADSGSHDDAVMKWAIAYMMLRQRRQNPQILLIPDTVGGATS